MYVPRVWLDYMTVASNIMSLQVVSALRVGIARAHMGTVIAWYRVCHLCVCNIIKFESCSDH